MTNMDDFDRQFEDQWNQHKRVMKDIRSKAIVGIFISGAVGVGLIAGIGYVAVHFLSKWW